ncbi:hypothetical protein ACEWL3_001960 [Sulfitobacter sp. MF3-043]
MAEIILKTAVAEHPDRAAAGIKTTKALAWQQFVVADVSGQRTGLDVLVVTALLHLRLVVTVRRCINRRGVTARYYAFLFLIVVVNDLSDNSDAQYRGQCPGNISVICICRVRTKCSNGDRRGCNSSNEFAVHGLILSKCGT